MINDCVSSQKVKNRTSELVRLGLNARHYGLSVVVLTQQLTSMSKPFRENVSKLVTIFYPLGRDMQTFFEDYLGVVSKGERQEIIKK